METNRLEDRSRRVREVRWIRDSVEMKVSSLSHNDRCLRNAHLDCGNWGEVDDSVGEGAWDRSSLVGVSTISSTFSAMDSGRGVLWNEDCREGPAGLEAGVGCLRAASFDTASMNRWDTSSSLLRMTVRLHKLSDSLSQPSSVLGSTSMHSKLCRLRNASNGNAFSFGGSPATSAICLGPGARSDNAGILVKLLKI